MEQHLKSVYGFNNFRDYQRDIISDLLEGKDVFAILPTGGGKSLLYQFPATFTKKTTIVVSPLISLMNDQCMYLNSINISSVCLNSETNIDISQYKNYKIIYATPEFITTRIKKIMKIKEEIGLFAIDESHCVSQWSHDFRHSYMELSIIKKTFPSIPLLAVTATATPRVIKDIFTLLNLTDVKEYLLGTRRTNLEISVLPKKEFDKCQFTEQTIIYVLTRKVCESLYNDLMRKGIKTGYYHGGMSKKEKDDNHKLFTNGEILVIVATVSFGMGIDKSDIRRVINYGVPTDIETYYQEIGRAGRDGLQSKAVLYYSTGDWRTVMFLINLSDDPKQIAIKKKSMNTLRKYIEEKFICRQQIIEYYFKNGEFPTEDKLKNIPKCNMCDNCIGHTKNDLVDMSEETKTIFKIIGRQHKNNGFTFGMTKTVDMVKKHILFDKRHKSWIKELINILINKNILIRLNKKFGPIITTGNKPTLLPINIRIENKFVNQFVKMDYLNDLKELRKNLAKKNNLIHSEFINERVILNIHEKKPKTLSELWKVDGISNEFIMKYGNEFIDKYKGIITPKKSNGKKKTNCKKKNDTILKYYNEGKTMEEISKITNKNLRSIEESMLNIFEFYDIDIDPDYFGLTEEYEEEIKKVVKFNNFLRLKPIKTRVNNNITYSQIKLCLLIIKIEGTN